MSNPSDPITF